MISARAVGLRGQELQVVLTTQLSESGIERQSCKLYTTLASGDGSDVGNILSGLAWWGRRRGRAEQFVDDLQYSTKLGRNARLG